jgi:hypothetical protein
MGFHGTKNANENEKKKTGDFCVCAQIKKKVVVALFL